MGVKHSLTLKKELKVRVLRTGNCGEYLELRKKSCN